MTRPTTLSKSRFKLALECPTKVFYSLDRRYVNAKDDDEFLAALADGGFQVGELAKRMFTAEDPAAVEVTARDHDQQVRQTAELLAHKNVTIFEGTVRHGDYLVRVDVLRKRGDVVELIEVKSKSFKAGQEAFRGSRGNLTAEWRPYFFDVAFQTWVFGQAYPALAVRPSLLLIDPRVTCAVDGLGAAIRVTRGAANGRHVQVTVDPALNLVNQRSPLLTLHDVTEEVDGIVGGMVEVPSGTYAFTDFVREMADTVAAGRKAEPVVSVACKKCEYYCEPGERTDDVRSGFAECIEQRFPGRGEVPRSATVFALFNDRGKAGVRALAHGKVRLSDLDDSDVGEEESAVEISLAHRHRLQIEEARGGGEAGKFVLREESLLQAFASWTFPLHFIDFETSRPVLPFVAGRRPNQQLLFQFSHHVLDADGRLEHRTECLVAAPGVVPNAAVVRALRDALSKDTGTVLHWWDHERTVLKDMRDELRSSAEPDRDELVAFIGSLIDGGNGARARLVDMGRPLVAKVAFFAGTDGRSSIKKVLPSVLAQSEYLRQRYSQPLYGTADMPSLNFPADGWVWWRKGADGRVVDPYELLGHLLPDADLDAVARAAEEDESSSFVANGGAAMVAYGLLQQPDLPASERARLEGQLKRYCELDTLAMRNPLVFPDQLEVEG